MENGGKSPGKNDKKGPNSSSQIYVSLSPSFDFNAVVNLLKSTMTKRFIDKGKKKVHFRLWLLNNMVFFIEGCAPITSTPYFGSFLVKVDLFKC